MFSIKRACSSPKSEITPNVVGCTEIVKLVSRIGKTRDNKRCYLFCFHFIRFAVLVRESPEHDGELAQVEPAKRKAHAADELRCCKIDDY